MTRKRANQFQLAMCLMLYGVITLSGPALHALPGFGHDSAGLTSEQGAAPGQGDRENTAVHFLKSSINPIPWRALATRALGEVISADSY